MAKQQITISDIAQALGVTPSTVSRALAGNLRVSAATRQRVADMAAKMGYQPNVLASSLRRGTSDTVGMVLPRVNRHFFSHVISGVEALLNPGGFNLLICQTHEQLAQEKKALRTFLNNRVGAVIVSHSIETSSFEHLMEVVEEGTPLVQFDRTSRVVPGVRIVNDNFLGGLSATRHLIKQGCRRIVHMAGALHVTVYKERLEGYRYALEEAGIPYDPSLVVENCITQEAGFEGVDRLFSTHPLDGIFAASDYSALGALSWLKSRKVKIPDEVRVVGFANEPFAELIEPALSSVEQNAFEMGNQIARVVMSYLRNQEVPDEEIQVPVRLMVRGSSENITLMSQP